MKLEASKSPAAPTSTADLDCPGATGIRGTQRISPVRDGVREWRETELRAGNRKASVVETVGGVSREEGKQPAAASGGSDSAAETEEAVDQGWIRADLVRVHLGSSSERATGKAGPSKRRRGTSSPSESTPEEARISSANQSPARMEPDEHLQYGSQGLGEFMSALGFPSFEGEGTNEAPIQFTSLDGQPSNEGNTGQQGSFVNTTPGSSKQARKRVCVQKKNTNFCPNEDKLLVMSYLEVSNDPVVNTSQKLERMWIRILKLYNQKKGSYPERTLRSAQSRWDVIKVQVGKFCGYYAEVLRGNHSGMTDADKTSLAACQFAEAEGHPFQFMHCWDIMKDEPKWMETRHSRGQNPMPANQGIDAFMQDSRSVPDANSPSPGTESAKRPLGRDATKAARKKGTTGSSSSVSADFAANMHELTLTKNNLWDRELNRRAVRDDEQLRLNREQLELEREKVELQRISEEERILSIDLDNVANEKLRAYYKKLQDKILNRP